MQENPENPHQQPPANAALLKALTAETDSFVAQHNNQCGLFTVMKGNDWLAQASKRPIPEMLFSQYWYEGELCILFADTNTGKSILAVQIADSISRGIPIPGFQLAAPAQPVVYFDFEMFDKQFEARYSLNYTQHYSFHTNFERAEINPDNPIPDTYKYFEDYIHDSIAWTINRTAARILIIDNITYLRQETERAKDALPLMKKLKSLKLQYELSILVLAHTPKRDMSKPITRNDLSGSKMLINFCDSSFCIGECSNDKNMRYLKQIKVRSNQFDYGADNVALCRIEKPHNFLRFAWCSYGTEREYLREVEQQEDNNRDWLIGECKRLKEENTNWSQQRIADELGISAGSVNKYLKL